MFLIALQLCTHRRIFSQGPQSGSLKPPKQPQWKQQQRHPADSV